jgi:ParB-like chromosome segregation protein Spo0J
VPKKAQVEAEVLDITELLENPENVRDHTPRSVGTIVESVQFSGVGRSGVVDEGNMLLAGHGTKEALVEAGIRRVIAIDAKGDEWVVVRRRGMSKAQKRALAIADNRANELSAFKAEELALQLTALRDEGVPLSRMGFEEGELARMLSAASGPSQGNGEPLPDRVVAMTERYGVIVICQTEQEQQQVYERLHGEGLNCRVVVV